MRIVDMPEFKDKSQLLTFEENVFLYDAVKAMADKNAGACLITDGGKLSGIFTERDLLRKVAAIDMDMRQKKLKDVMTKGIKTSLESDHVSDCMRRMNQGRFRHLPIVDENKNIVGMLNQSDFVAFTMADAATRANEPMEKEDRRIKNAFTVLAIVIYTLALYMIFKSWL